MSAEKPPTGWVAPGAGAGAVLMTPANGAGAVASAGRIARPRRLGVGGAQGWAPAAGAAASAAAAMARTVGRWRLLMRRPHRAGRPRLYRTCERLVIVLGTIG